MLLRFAHLGRVPQGVQVLATRATKPPQQLCHWVQRWLAPPLLAVAKLSSALLALRPQHPHLKSLEWVAPPRLCVVGIPSASGKTSVNNTSVILKSDPRTCRVPPCQLSLPPRSVNHPLVTCHSPGGGGTPLSTGRRRRDRRAKRRAERAVAHGASRMSATEPAAERGGTRHDQLCRMRPAERRKVGPKKVLDRVS